MHYSILRYLINGLIPRFMTEFLSMRTFLETLSDHDKEMVCNTMIAYLNIQITEYKPVSIDPQVPEQYQEYVQAAKILAMIQKLFNATHFEVYLIKEAPNLSVEICQVCINILQHFVSKLQPLKAIALSERHVNDYYIKEAIHLVSEQANFATFRIINQLYSDTNEQKKFTELKLNIIFETLLKSPVSYNMSNFIFQEILNNLALSMNKLLEENKDLKKNMILESQEKITKNQKMIDNYLQGCFLIMEKFVFPITMQVKKSVLDLYQPLLLMSEKYKKYLLEILEQYQLENSIYIYDRFLKNLNDNVKLEPVKKKLNIIFDEINKKNYIKAIILMARFYYDNEEKYTNLSLDQPFTDFFNLNKKLYSPSNFETLDYRNAIIELSSMCDLKKLIMTASNKNSLLFYFLQMPELTAQDLNNINKNIKNMQETFIKNPCPEINIDQAYQVSDKIHYQDLKEFYQTIKHYTINDNSHGIFIPFRQRNQLIVNIAVELCKTLEEIIKKIPQAKPILDIDANQQCLYFAMKFSNQLGLAFNHPLRVHLYAMQENQNLDPVIKRNHIIDRIFITFQDAMANKNFYFSHRIEKELLKLMDDFNSDQKARFIVLMMSHKLLKFLEQTTESIIQKRIKYIHTRLICILRRMGKAIPIEKQQFYRDELCFSSEAILEDIVQQLHKELLLLRPLMPVEFHLSWLDKAKKIWYGDEFKKLYVVLENLLTEYQPHFPEHCQKIIPAMAKLRCDFNDYEFLVNERKFNLAQDKREGNQMTTVKKQLR